MTDCNNCKHETECNHTKRYDYTHTGILDYSLDKEYNSFKDISELLNEQEETLQKQNQEITACHDTLTTILEYVDAILNGLDIQDLFIKDYFKIIKNRDLNRMNKIIMELNGSDD